MIRLLTICVGLAFVSFCRADDRPNILIILADDLGYSDIGCYGGEIPTPNLDALAERGVRLTDFSVTPRCCPTRASLLTGVAPHAAGMGWMSASNQGRPGYRGDLRLDTPTIAERLREEGYRCYMTGKWHVTYDGFLDGSSKHNWPLQRGFDRFYGIIGGGASYFRPPDLARDNRPIPRVRDGYYLTDVIGDEMAEYLVAHGGEESNAPFFAYLSFTAPHWPLHAPAEAIEKHTATYERGWEATRDARIERQRRLGLLDESAPVPPWPHKAWRAQNERQRRLWVKRMATYAAQVELMDAAIGRVLDALEESGQLEHTVIVFLSDNGASAEEISRGDTSLAALGSEASFESYRTEWATVSNAPFRGHKILTLRGGVASPLIVAGPVVPSERMGTVCREVGHVTDLMPTCLSLAGVEGESDGVDLVPGVVGGTLRDRTICWEHRANRAVRSGKWRMVSAPGEGWRLYDLDSDPCETRDVAARHPEIVERLAGEWDAWAERNNVFPLDGGGWYEHLRQDQGPGDLIPPR